MLTVHPQEAITILEQKDALLIDVREPAEHAAMHISSATLAPLSKLKNFNLPQGITQVIVHCKSGMRAANAIKLLQARYPSITFKNLDKGIDGWQQAGFTVSKSEKAGFALDRQVQLTIGSMVLLGSVMGYFVDPLWMALSGFFGAGLIFAGTTGTCGLALVIARMPWNQN